MWWGQQILEDEARFMTKRHSGFKAMSATNLLRGRFGTKKFFERD